MELGNDGWFKGGWLPEVPVHLGHLPTHDWRFVRIQTSYQLSLVLGVSESGGAT